MERKNSMGWPVPASGTSTKLPAIARTSRATLALAACLLTLPGCANRYDITLTNGGKITGVSRPKFEQKTGHYYFKDAKGEVQSVSQMRVTLIEVK